MTQKIRVQKGFEKKLLSELRSNNPNGIITLASKGVVEAGDVLRVEFVELGLVGNRTRTYDPFINALSLAA